MEFQSIGFAEHVEQKTIPEPVLKRFPLKLIRDFHNRYRLYLGTGTLELIVNEPKSTFIILLSGFLALLLLFRILFYF